MSEDMIMGNACKRIPGLGIESCYLWQEAQGETKETINAFRPMVERHPDCPLQKEILTLLESTLST